LTIADDQFALSATDRHHRVDRFQTCLQWFFSLAGGSTTPGAMRSDRDK
jgi:hypothetical protein